MERRVELAVIGGGPAGLRAAEMAAAAGIRVTVFDAKLSVGRKFLVAGKGGLNLTHGEAIERFVTRYSGPDLPATIWQDMLADFGPQHTRSWAADLGIETFQAGTGRVYPSALKAAPLLRRWIARLKSSDVRFEMNHRWTGLVPGSPHLLHFSNGSTVAANAVVLALGGGSWPQTGSDGGWMEPLHSLGIDCHPLIPANCGWETRWADPTLDAGEGKPLKNIEVSAGETRVAGELMITRHGLEGGAIYQLGPVLRAMPLPAVAIDFKPTFSVERLVTKMESVRRNFLSEAGVRWRLSEAALAILSRTGWHDATALAIETKNCVIPLTRPRPLVEAISTAGGVRWHELEASLMLKKIPGCFVAGEMIDWEAPTGGYLIQGCLSTGHRAGLSAAQWLKTPH